MSLLQGYLNINPTGTGGPEISIVDDTALSFEGENTGAFIDAGKTGKGEIAVYVVHKGDTLPQVAKMFGVSTNTIIWANSLKSNKLTEGQELVILPISGVRHTVKLGETLSSIAKKYKADLGDVLAYNDFTSGQSLKVGDVVIVPDGVVSISAGSPGKVTGSSGSLPSIVGYYMRPLVAGRKTQGIHGYNGVDIAAPIGTPLRASASGKVIVAKSGGYNGGYGSYVVISHPNGTQTLYGHMSRVDVTVGESVEQGENIGAVGSTGRSTGPHVHFEVRGAKNPF